jgi:hypothetical protein
MKTERNRRKENKDMKRNSALKKKRMRIYTRA